MNEFGRVCLEPQGQPPEHHLLEPACFRAVWPAVRLLSAVFTLPNGFCTDRPPNGYRSLHCGPYRNIHAHPDRHSNHYTSDRNTATAISNPWPARMLAFRRGNFEGIA